MKSTLIIAVLGLAAAGFAPSAAAQMSSGYAGGSVGRSDFRFGGCTSPCDSKGRAVKLFGGYRLQRNVALELGYANFGKGTIGSTTIKGTSWDLSAVLTWPIAHGFSVLGRLGGYNGDVTQTSASTGGETKHGTANLTYGLGGQADLSRELGARAEWQRYSKMGGGGLGQKSDVDTLTVGIFWRFQ